MLTKTSAEAQNQFGQLLDLAQREPVAVTRHGRPAVFVLSSREMEEFKVYQEEKRARAVAAYKAWRLKYKDQFSPEAAKLTDEEVNRMVHELR